MVTCSCGFDLEDIGIIKSKKTKLFHRVYRCENKECKKTFKANPGHSNPQALLNRPVYRKAINLYEAFNMKPMDQMYMQKISLPSNKNPLVHLGKLAGVLYKSDKESNGRHNPGGVNKLQTYIHECHSPHPDFYVTADGKTFLIANGQMHIPTEGQYKGWLVD
jgi:hypothetical protein